MAYMDQEKKAVIAEALKRVIPKDWKYSLSVRNHLSICLTIQSAPVDLVRILESACAKSHGLENVTVEAPTYWQVNGYGVVDQLIRIGREDLATHFDNIIDALNTGNHDNSDIQTDYFDVGHYVDINIGRWNKPFVCTAKGAS